MSGDTTPQKLNVASALRRFGSDMNLYQRVCGVFMTSSREQLDRLWQARHTNNISEMKRMSHSLKSACANVGAEIASQLAADLEHAITQDETAGHDGRINHLAEELASVFAHIHNLV